MPKKNVTVVKRVVAAGAAFVGVLALCASAGAAPVSPFREVRVVEDAFDVQSDGVRFAWAKYWRSRVEDEVGVVVFDTRSGRRYELAAPAPGCRFASIGGNLAVWRCFGSTPSILLTDLLTGQNRPPTGIEKVERMNQPWGYWCLPDIWGTQLLGRYWLEFSCGTGIGPRSTRYLNHRDGRVTGEIDLDIGPYAPRSRFIDPDYIGLFRPYCAPLGAWDDGSPGPPYLDYAPPFALYAPRAYGPTGFGSGGISLRRCGTKRAETLTRCPLTDCRTPQLGSDYVTWGEHKRVYAYLPRIRRRLLVGRAPAGFVRGRALIVAHTCNRVFARWGTRVYEARFDPARGAPPCQHRG